MDLKNILLFIALVALTRASPEAEPEAQAEAMPEAEPQAQNLYGTGPIAPAPQMYNKPEYYPTNQVGPGGMPPGGGPSVISGKPDYYPTNPVGPGSQPDFGMGYYPTNQVGPGGMPPGGGQPEYYPTNPVGPGGMPPGGGQPDFGYPPIYDNPDPGFGGFPPNYYPVNPVGPGGGPLDPSKPDYNPGKPDYNPGGPSKPDYNPGGSTCQMTDQCCGMDKENCCMGNERKQSYTAWERVCDQDTELECPVTVQRQCYPIRVPNCRTVTDIRRRTFQTKKCVPKPMRKCFDIEIKECNMGSRTEEEEVSWTNQQLKKIETKTEKKCYTVQSKDCTNRTVTETQRLPVQKQRTINETRQQCQMVQKRMPDRTVTVTVTRPQYKQMCYNMPVPRCSQSPCQSRAGGTGTCSSGTSPCSLQQTNNVNVCPFAAQGQTKPPYATGGCQQVQQPACNMGRSTCDNNNQQCCKTENRKVCKTVMIRVPQQVKQTIPGGVQWTQDCRPYTYSRVVPYTEWETKTVDRVKYNCRPVTKQECHDLEYDKYDIVTVQEKGNVSIPLPTCNPQTRTINKCFNLPQGDVECIDTPVEKLIRVTSQVCDGEKYIQKCFKIGVARCYESSVPNCRMVPRQVSVPTCSQSSNCNSCNRFVNSPEYGGCPNSKCPRVFGGGEEYRSMGNTTVVGETSGDVGGSIPSSGGPFYPYGQQTGFLVEDVDQPDVLN